MTLEELEIPLSAPEEANLLSQLSGCQHDQLRRILAQRDRLVHFIGIIHKEAQKLSVKTRRISDTLANI